MPFILKKPLKCAASQNFISRSALPLAYTVCKKSRFGAPSAFRPFHPCRVSFYSLFKWCGIDLSGNTLRLSSVIKFNDNRNYVEQIISKNDSDRLWMRLIGDCGF